MFGKFQIDNFKLRPAEVIEWFLDGHEKEIIIVLHFTYKT